MAAFTTRKIILHRNNLRLTSGQHDVWCDKDVGVRWSQKEACMKHLKSTRERYDKSVSPEDIYSFLPEITRRPKLCQTIVPLDHFKFIGGVDNYLTARAEHYKKRGKFL